MGEDNRRSKRTSPHTPHLAPRTVVTTVVTVRVSSSRTTTRRNHSTRSSPGLLLRLSPRARRRCAAALPLPCVTLSLPPACAGRPPPAASPSPRALPDAAAASASSAAAAASLRRRCCAAASSRRREPELSGGEDAPAAPPSLPAWPAAVGGVDADMSKGTGFGRPPAAPCGAPSACRGLCTGATAAPRAGARAAAGPGASAGDADLTWDGGDAPRVCGAALARLGEERAEASLDAAGTGRLGDAAACCALFPAALSTAFVGDAVRGVGGASREAAAPAAVVAGSSPAALPCCWLLRPLPRPAGPRATTAEPGSDMASSCVWKLSRGESHVGSRRSGAWRSLAEAAEAAAAAAGGASRVRVVSRSSESGGGETLVVD